MEWVRDTTQYACGKNLKLGAIIVGGARYDSRRSKNDPNKWQAWSRLPGIRASLGHHADEPSAMKQAEEAALFWIKKAGLTATNNGANHAE